MREWKIILLLLLLVVTVAVITAALVSAFLLGSHNLPQNNAVSDNNIVDLQEPPSQDPVLNTTPSEKYETGPVQREFPYIVNAKRGEITITLHAGVYNGITDPSIPACAFNKTSCTHQEIQHYFTDNINEPVQKQDLDSLVDAIKSKTPKGDDQVRIAISLVQNIPYDNNEVEGLDNGSILTERTPYEVLYDNGGICEDKSFLLAYLLRGLGYGVTLFSFPVADHMVVGVKTPTMYAYDNTSYAFVETTTPLIITDGNELYGSSYQKLTEVPSMYVISDGNSFSPSYELHDAREFNQLNLEVEQNGCQDPSVCASLYSLGKNYGMRIPTMTPYYTFFD